MILRRLALALALTSFATLAFAADNNTFIITTRAGKQVGKASYTIDKTKQGFRVKARYEYRLSAPQPDMPSGDPNSGAPIGAMMTEAQYISEYNVDANGNYISGYTQNASTQIITSFQPDKARSLITIGTMQGGVSGGSNPVPVPSPDFLVAPDYDPSAIQVLLNGSLAHPHADNKYTLVVPASGAPRQGSKVIYVALQPMPDATGTLDGKPVTLKHYQILFVKTNGNIYTDANGALMQADMGPLAASYVRAKFVLTPQ